MATEVQGAAGDTAFGEPVKGMPVAAAMVAVTVQEGEARPGAGGGRIGEVRPEAQAAGIITACFEVDGLLDVVRAVRRRRCNGLWLGMHAFSSSRSAQL